VNVKSIFEVANHFVNKGNGQLALQLWQECVREDSDFGSAYLRIGDAYEQMGNIKGSLDCFTRWQNCRLTPNEVKLIPQVESKVAELTKKLNGSPPKPPDKK